MLYNPLAISNYFINKSFATGSPLTPMKLLKLVYISHGWYLGLFEKELITEAVQAWKYGPVIPSVYETFRSFGRGQITKMVDVNGETPMVDDADTQMFLDAMWQRYQHLDGLQLSELTHQPNTPWDITWNKKGGCSTMGTIIPNDLIQQHYKEKLNAA